MMKGKAFFLWILIFAAALQISGEPIYQQFCCYADPLYSPWLCHPEFLEMDQKYPECHAEGYFKEGRFLQYALARQAACLKEEGDFIECGVYRGKSLDIFASVLDAYSPNRRLYGFDSFQGLEQPTQEDIMPEKNESYFKKGSIKGWNKPAIEKRLAYHQCSIELIKGWIPESFTGFEDKKFVFAHIDVDLYNATYASLEFIYPRMEKGGIILFDDYGFPMCLGARKAIDDYLEDKLEKAIPILSGQAFLIKQ